MKINLLHKNIAILWFWREWKSTLRFLQKNGIMDLSITILDRDKNLEIKDFEWKIVSWDKYLDDLDRFDYIFKSPWVSSYIDELVYHKDKILTQAKIFFEYYDWRIISITGTKGKSTTATLTYNLLKNAWYNVKLVWNIWNPVLSEIDVENDKYDFVVYELSSYMLEELTNHHSTISVFINIFKDHLDWHRWFENYFSAKKHILNWAENILVWEELYSQIKKELKEKDYHIFGWKKWYYSHDEKTFFVNKSKLDIKIDPKIPWNHNLDNICAILGIANILNIDFKIFENTINNFNWLFHRLENIWTYAGITFIDDAISTTPESTIQAIKTFQPNITTIYLGWSDRWYDFTKLWKIINKSKIENIILFPSSWEKIKEFIKIGKFNVFETDNMKDAIRFTFENTPKWTIALLSTASPSYSLWTNFEHQWKEFKDEVLAQYKDYE